MREKSSDPLIFFPCPADTFVLGKVTFLAEPILLSISTGREKGEEESGRTAGKREAGFRRAPAREISVQV